jgi:hypothetical protein
MGHLRHAGRACVALAFAAALAATASGQVNLPAESIGGPLGGQLVQGAPFTADATTTVRAILGDGTRVDQSTTDRYYRDSVGRVRVEKLMNGLPAPTTMAERHVRTIIVPDPIKRIAVTLDAQTRTARNVPRSLLSMTAGGNRAFSIPVGGVRFVDFRRAADLLSADPGAFTDVREESLGSQRIAGVEATGRRVTLVVPAGYHGNDEPIEMVDERWESAELQLLVQSRHSDSRGTIEYRLSNIRRTEAPSRYFEIPLDYNMDSTATTNDPWLSFTAAESPRARAFIAGKLDR